MTEAPVQIIYDGDCPFCANFMRLSRLRQAAGRVELIDARSDHPLVARARAAGLDLDEGMAMLRNGRWSHGDQVLNEIALMSTPSTAFNRLNARLFSDPDRARRWYPALRAGRNLALRLLGRRKIADTSPVRA